jgi:hypothetical protein
MKIIVVDHIQLAMAPRKEESACFCIDIRSRQQVIRHEEIL